jgi:putative transposase
MSFCALRKGARIKIGVSEFVILQRLPEAQWQLQNTATGEWRTFSEAHLLDRFAHSELSFMIRADESGPLTDRLAISLARDLSFYSPELVALARNRMHYLKKIDTRQPIDMTLRVMQPLIQQLAEEIADPNPPGWRTLCRDYRKWIASGRDIRAITPRYSERGKSGSRMAPETKAISDQVIDQLYMTAERKRVPEVHLEVVRRVEELNEFRAQTERLSIPSRRTIYREIERRPPYEVMVARYGKRRAEMAFRISGAGPHTSRSLQRVVMDHTPSDLIVVDDNSMLPLGRPTITTALDEYTRCPMGFYAGFEPPSCLSVMRCLKHAILPKTYVPREFPSIKNCWECYGVPELLVVDNPPEFHSSHFERACLQIGTDIQYAKVQVPWYKGTLERFQGTMNRDLMQGNPGTTFSNILERDDYDPGQNAVVMLSTFREILHKWIIDVYLQTPHRGIQDTPAHRWHSERRDLPPPLPPSADELAVVLGMTVQRVIFHYGIELEGLKYNSPELGELRRRLSSPAKVELIFDPGDLGHINVADRQKGTYIRVPAVDQAYAKGMSLWQHRVVRRYSRHRLNGRTDLVALATAKAEIRALVDRDLNRKSVRGRKRHARFMEGSSAPGRPERVVLPENPRPSQIEGFSDDQVLPVFEANLELPSVPVKLVEPAEMRKQ